MGSDQVVSQHPILEIKLHRVKIDAKPIGYWLFPGLVLNRHIYIYIYLYDLYVYCLYVNPFRASWGHSKRFRECDLPGLEPGFEQLSGKPTTGMGRHKWAHGFAWLCTWSQKSHGSTASLAWSSTRKLYLYTMCALGLGVATTRNKIAYNFCKNAS